MRHRQRRVDGRGCAQETPYDLQLAFGPGRLGEAEDEQGNVPDEEGEICQCAGQRRAK
jgi:hypothetical protein